MAKQSQPARERLAEKVQAKIRKGQQLTNADLLALNGQVQIYDPAAEAYRTIPVEDAEKFVQSTQALAEALK
jgi:hypothetical protein